MNRNFPALIISLDFELLWGVFDKVDHLEKKEYFENTRNLIPKLLKLFKEYDIHVTWATVGMLFNRNWDEWMENIPEVKPEYHNAKLSPYKFAEKNRNFINENLCFANSLIDDIIKAHGQELGTHTYSHYYCLEPGQTASSFRNDLEMAIKLAGNRNVQLKSLVFPRNQFNQEYLNICKQLGITSVRTNPDNWYWKNTQKDSILQKVFRTGDAYIGLNDKPYAYNDLKHLPQLQKASRLLRPKSESSRLNDLKLKRIKSELTFTAKNNKIYHLWWHPHNFGNDPEGNLADLKLLLEHFKTLQDSHGMRSLNMDELYLLSQP